MHFKITIKLTSAAYETILFCLSTVNFALPVNHEF